MLELWPGDEPLQLVPLDALDQTLIDQSHALILGISTWNFGELQEDWEAAWDSVCRLNFNDKHVAVFGLGDQLGYGEWFVDAMGLLAEQLSVSGAMLTGEWSAEGYSFDASKAFDQTSNTFVGLALDEDSQSYDTDARIEAWLRTIYETFKYYR